MAPLTISERVWLKPSGNERQTWAQVYAAVRSAMGIASSVVLPSATIVDAVDRAVHYAWPRCFHHELLKVTAIVDTPESITLPFAPSYVFNVFWLDEADTTDLAKHIPNGMWAVENDSWRWLGGDTYWPTDASITWTMEVIGKPRPSALETVYCPVPLQVIIPLATIECSYQLAMQRGPLNAAIEMQSLQILRERVLVSLPRMRPPSRLIRVNVNNMTTSIWTEAGQDDITFADLR